MPGSGPAPSQGPVTVRRPPPAPLRPQRRAVLAPEPKPTMMAEPARCQKAGQHCCCPRQPFSRARPGSGPRYSSPSECQEWAGGPGLGRRVRCVCSFRAAAWPQVSGPVRPWRSPPSPQQMLGPPAGCAGRWAPGRPGRPEHAGSPWLSPEWRGPQGRGPGPPRSSGVWTPRLQWRAVALELASQASMDPALQGLTKPERTGWSKVGSAVSSLPSLCLASTRLPT